MAITHRQAAQTAEMPRAGALGLRHSLCFLRFLERGLNPAGSTEEEAAGMCHTVRYQSLHGCRLAQDLGNVSRVGGWQA